MPTMKDMWRPFAERAERERWSHDRYLGPSGTGKSHLAAGIGIALVERGYRVLYARATDLVQKLQPAWRRQPPPRQGGSPLNSPESGGTTGRVRSRSRVRRPPAASNSSETDQLLLDQATRPAGRFLRSPRFQPPKPSP